MRVILIAFLLAVFSMFPYVLPAQNVRITVSQDNISVGNLLKQIEEQTEYLFVYNKRNVDTNRIISINMDNASVSAVLNKAFEGTGIKYVMEGNNIVLTRSSDTGSTSKQNILIVRGTVTDMKGEEIIGANVVEQGTSNGIITDIMGNFALAVSPNAKLTISYIGYRPVIIPVDDNTNLIIRLEEEALMLESVVVTAMGIKKKEASLTYATQLINSEEITRAKDPNFINSLTGKIAGVQVARNSSGLGGSTKVSIRGSRSINGNNQPLYVIDGVPILNNSNEQAYTAIGGINNAGNRDGGDGISNLNPDDIESLNILKGASAAALYGSQAANGVIVITTKKGAPGVQRLTFSSGVIFENAIASPKLQNSYGMNSLEKNSWGDKGGLKKYDHIGDFFKTGTALFNSLALTTGNDKLQTYFSYGNTNVDGIVDKNSLKRHNVYFRETANFFDNSLTIDAAVHLISQTVKNRPISGGYYMNPLVGLYTYPRGEDISEYRTNFEVHDASRNMMRQNWYTSYHDFEQNPYWLINRSLGDDKRTRIIASATANLKLTPWLTLQARGTADYTHDEYEQRIYATTAPSIAGDNGRYIHLDHKENLYYGDVMALANYNWKDFSVNGAIGSSINKYVVNSLRLDSKTASLYYPNVFTVANIRMNQAANIEQRKEDTRILQSLFATAQLGWKESLYLDFTARNDWASTLAYTNHTGFFYPSVGASWVMNNTMHLPEWVSYGKLRASWSKVGNDLQLFISNSIPGSNDQIGAGGAIISYPSAPFETLKPEMSTSYEIGADLKLFNYRIDLDITYYKTDTRNQLFILPTTAGATHRYYMVNAGKITNQGVEVTLGATPTLTENFRWKTQANFSTNRNKVVRLHPDLKTFVYGDENFSSSYSMRLVEGSSIGDIYGKAFQRDENGKIVTNLNENGNPIPSVIGEGNTIKVGNCNPDFLLGWSNTLTYKDFSFYALIDGRFGGEVLSQTEAELDQRGVSLATAQARDRGYVDVNGTHVAPRDFYTAVSGRMGCTEYYMYNATNIRLREVSLSYKLPQKLISRVRFLHGVNLSLIGHNLFFIHRKAPFDPDAIMSVSNDNQGIDVFGTPSTRSIGFNLKLIF